MEEQANQVETISIEEKWKEYKIPLNLPQPKAQENRNTLPIIVVGVILAVLLGAVLAYVSYNFIYIIGIYEYLVGFIIAFALTTFIAKSNVQDLNKLTVAFLIISFTLLLSNLYMGYYLVQDRFESLSFMKYIRLLFKAGLTIKDFNAGWFGLLVKWALLVFIPFSVIYARAEGILMNQVLERVPIEVMEYVVYLFDHDKTADEVRSELAKKGWKTPEDQDDVFLGITVLQSTVKSD